MKTLLLTFMFVIMSMAIPLETAFSQTYVQGYYRSDGTYVAPHWRSSPNRSYNDNWSVKPNYNPYKGKSGTRNPTWNNQNPYRDPYKYNLYR